MLLGSELIIVAMDPSRDLRSRESLYNWINRVVDDTRDLVYGYKVGLPLLLSGGVESFEYIKKRSGGKFLIADLKLADIGDIMTISINYLREVGVDGVIAHVFIGYEDALDKLSRVLRENGMKLILVVSMSHRGSTQFIDKHIDEFIEVAVKCEAWGVVAPATRPEVISYVRSRLGGGVKILSPGIGAQGASPGSAICSGADYEIIGRLITHSENPRQRTLEIINEMRERIERCKRS